MKVIAVTGTAGSGKTFFAKKLARKKGYLYFDTAAFLKKHKIYDRYNKKLATYEVDTDKFVTVMSDVLKGLVKEGWKGVVLDGHLSHYLSSRLIDLVYIVRCDVKELRKRLKKRGYKKNKIEENVEAEIMETCLIEAKDFGHKIKVIISNTN